VAADPLIGDRDRAWPKAAAESADNEIVRSVQADARPHEICVVTSDGALTNRVPDAGASVCPAGRFRNLVEPRD
jgi:predicted RNA-binding protein with PIN domain